MEGQHHRRHGHDDGGWPGQNSLQFIVYNANPGSNNPTGLRYEFLHAAAMPSAQ